jgi:chromatin remodeling complex protein RSC6
VLSEQSSPKKLKVEVEPAMKSSESGPSVIISEALANFFGVVGREMLQSEVLRRIWEYIKLNNLEVGLVLDKYLHDAFNSMDRTCFREFSSNYVLCGLCDAVQTLGVMPKES